LARRAQRASTSADGEFTMSSVYLQSLIPEDPTGGDVPLSLKIDHFPTVIGRSPECDYRISNALISRRHCSFFERDNELFIRDLGSRNGTHLNGLRLMKEAVVHEGDRLDIGYLPYRVCLPKPVAWAGGSFARALSWKTHPR
jgi:hypothetical protein